MKEKKVQKEHKKGSKEIFLIVISILLGLNLIFGFYSFYDKSKSIEDMQYKIDNMDQFFSKNFEDYGSNSNLKDIPNKDNNNNMDTDDDPFLGNENAKVKVVEFSDYQCPFCRKYWTETYPQLKEDFIDTGKIKYVFRDFPLNFHPGATPAAIAGNCILKESGDEAYFRYHDKVFSKQNELGAGTVEFNEKEVFEWAEEFIANQEKFKQCYNDTKQKEEVENDLMEGSKAGVSGTPSFFINGEMIVGAQPYSAIKAEIERALNS